MLSLVKVFKIVDDNHSQNSSFKCQGSNA